MPKMSEVHLALNCVVNYLYGAGDEGWPQISVLGRVSEEGPTVSSGRPGHKILCKEMDRGVAWAMPAYKALDKPEQQVVNVKYMYYVVGKNGRKATDVDRAKLLAISVRHFSRRYNDAARKVKKLLSNA